MFGHHGAGRILGVVLVIRITRFCISVVSSGRTSTEEYPGSDSNRA
jgi:hypothetical protein